MNKGVLPSVIEDTLVNKEDFITVDQIVNKTHLPILDSYPIVPFDDSAKIDIADSVCFFPIKKLVFDKEENNVQKLTSVYTSVAAIQANLAMLIRGYNGGETEVFLGVCNESNRINGAYPKAKAFYDSFVGNFPGCRDNSNILNREETHILVNSCFSYDYKAVSSVSCIGSLRGKNENGKNSAFYQGIEKVVETMNGKDYTILILAQPLSSEQLQSIRSELENLHSKLSIFSKINFSLNESEAQTISNSVSSTLSKSINESRSETLSVGKNYSYTEGNGTFSSLSGGVSIGSREGLGGSMNYARGKNHNESQTSGDFKSTATGKNTGETKTTSDSNTNGSSNALTMGQSIQMTIESKKISEILAVITQQLQRLKSGSGMGVFATSAYFLSPSLSEAQTAAGSYKAIVSGDATSVEYNGINAWTDNEFKEIVKYLKDFRHPVFQLSTDNDNNSSTTATPATIVTSSELAIQMGMPYHSINGLPVKESVTFGRNIVKLSNTNKPKDKLFVGNVYHLGLQENTRVEFDTNSLTMHTFITGTTGSGKSNAIYGILDKICKSDNSVKFLVVEPAKGEYKTVFANKKNVTVYGVNPYLTPLLKINPFRFRQGIHILEHIDRLLNIFNVCWPMEAAMPAILKQALERSYVTAGWDLQRSVNKFSNNLFPTFADVMQEVEEILNESQYSEDNKGDYVGALCTRLRELTTGLNGMIFVANDLSDEELFEENVIVDLSRIGSPETKSLIMGLVVVRLQEYRQVTQNSIQSKLSHLTVLEEAHHLLKKTSTEQSMDSANMVGKSVEILTNAFAEMRSAGEGFIIADQSPGLMNKSVIRNTNTKIILRLPENEDRELVGKSVGLSDMQIAELSKLPTGVAAVYQNDWMDAVLVKMPYYNTGNAYYSYTFNDDAIFDGNDDIVDLLERIVDPGKIDNMIDSLPGNRIDSITSLHLPTKVKKQLINYMVNKGEKKLHRLGKLACDFFNVSETINVSRTDSLDDWISDFKSYLKPSIREFDEWDQNTLLLIICSEYARRYVEFEPVYLSVINRLI